jgi:hypothetical protein
LKGTKEKTQRMHKSMQKLKIKSQKRRKMKEFGRLLMEVQRKAKRKKKSKTRKKQKVAENDNNRNKDRKCVRK